MGIHAKTIRASADERVFLLKRGTAYSVEIAGGEYGPFNWADACAWYRRHAVPPMREYVFKPYRAGCGPDFILRTWDANKTDHMGKHRLRYTLTMRTGKQSTRLFVGDDFACSPCYAIDSIGAAHALMGFLTLRPGDTDADYFAEYTPEQLAYCAAHAETLNCEVGARWEDKNGNLKARYCRR